MTVRAVILGLAAALFICGFCYFHDCVIYWGAVIRLVPHLMPPVVYGGLIVAVLLVNPVLKRLGRRPLTAAELAVTGAMALVACGIPFYGLVHCWPSALMIPHHINETTPEWQEDNALDLVPPELLADVSGDREARLAGYIQGMREGKRHVDPRAVPWSAWTGSMARWAPLALTITLTLVAFSVVLHQQWARHEQLPYPITKFAHALLPQAGGAPSVWSSRGFRAALLAVLGIHMYNYGCGWWPDILPAVQLRLDFQPFLSLFPEILWGDGRMLPQPLIMFSVVGISYFFASDVCLSLAVFPVIMCYVIGLLTTYNISVTRGFSLFNNTNVFLYTGGYVGVVIMMLYTGRRFYGSVLLRSLRLPAPDRPKRHFVWAMRLGLLGTALFVAQLMLMGLDWFLASLYTGIALVVFVAGSRAVAETGAYYIGTWVMPCAVLWGLLGSAAIGPEALTLMILVSVVLLIGPGWAPMAFVVQSLTLADLARVSVPKTAVWCGVALVLGLAVALPVTIYLQYDGGVYGTAAGWAHYTARLPFDQGLQMKRDLEVRGNLSDARRVSGWDRVSRISPHGPFLIAVLIGVGMAVVVSACRLRFSWWPLHPIVFVFLGSHQAQRLAFSFFLGWLVKMLTCRYGGEKLYQRLKPVMVGLVAGEVLAGALQTAIGVVYYLVTGERPIHYSLLL